MLECSGSWVDPKITTGLVAGMGLVNAKSSCRRSGGCSVRCT